MSLCLYAWNIILLTQWHHTQTNVGVDCWVPCRSTDFFGPDPDAFRPERWLDAPEDVASAMERAWFPFGGGSRACIGKNLALLEMSRVMPMIVDSFDVVVLDAEGRLSHAEEPVVHNNWFMKMPEFYARVVDRRSKVEGM